MIFTKCLHTEDRHNIKRRGDPLANKPFTFPLFRNKKELFNLEKSMVRDAHHKVIYLPHGKRATGSSKLNDFRGDLTLSTPK